jgi:hypothetical protein
MRKTLARLCSRPASWSRGFVIKLSSAWVAFATVLGVMGAGVAHATVYTASAVTASAVALGNTGNSDLLPIIFGVSGTGLLVLVSLFGVRAAGRVIASRRHTV